MANTNKDKQSGPVSPFSLKIGSAFGSRADDVFGSLGNIEAKHEAFEKVRVKSHDGKDGAGLFKDDPRDECVMAGGSRSSQTSWSARPEQNQDFKRPRAPPPKKRGSANRHDPGKWTYYNLDDVSSEDMSDRSNTAAALSFLQSRKADNPNKKQKTGHGEGMDVDCSSEDRPPKPLKHMFKKSSTKSAESSGTTEKKPDIQIAGRPGCVVMPEYVIGKKPSKNRPKGTKLSSGEKPSFSQLSMGHLFDDDDNDDVDDEDDQDGAGLEIKFKPKQSSSHSGFRLKGARSSRSSNTAVLVSSKNPTLFSDCLDDDEDHEMMDTDQATTGSKFQTKNKDQKSAFGGVGDVDGDSNSSSEAENTSKTKQLDLDGVD